MDNKTASSFHNFLRNFPFYLLVAVVIHPHQVYSYKEFDFIIVGGGTAGCVLANRLSENGKFSVLIIEKGGMPLANLSIPTLTPNHWTDSESLDFYPVVRQQYAAQASNGSITMIAGRMLGGTSSISNLFFNRGSPRDFDNWAKITGDEKWKYTNMLKYLKKSENYMGDFPSDEHGLNGPVTVSRSRYAPGLETWLSAGKELGYPIADPNGPQRISFTPAEFSKKFGRVVNAYNAYITPILPQRRNLEIMTHTQVSRIEFEGKRATGVTYTTTTSTGMPSPGFVRARREIIITSGTIGSPVLLMRSGVGPRDVLQAANVQQVKELPVGKNLHDHLVMVLQIVINNKSAVLDPERDLNSESWDLYNKFGDGPYSSTMGNGAQAFLASSNAKREGDADWADVHLTPLHTTFTPLGIVLNPLGNIASWEASLKCGFFLSRPKSRGSVKLNPADVDGPPVLDLQYMSHPRDSEVFLEAIKKALRIYEGTQAYRKLGARLPTIPFPGCEQWKFRSDDYWKCYIRQVAGFGFHPAGTCRMGRGSDDPEAVLDSNLRVIGMDGLRVCDASVMPEIVNTNPTAAILGIAEKLSDHILQSL